MYDECKKRALRILGKRTLSASGMAKRLISKGETPEAASEAVRWLTEMGYLNDSNYASLIVNHYKTRGYGEARIRNELMRREIPEEMWDEKLAAATADGGEQEDAAVGFLRKKLGNSVSRNDGMPDKDDLRKAQQALVRRGFSYDEARDAINKFMEETCTE